MESIYIRGIEYPLIYSETSISVETNETILVSEFCEDWQTTKDNLKGKLLEKLGLVEVTFRHHRNVTVRNAFGVFLKPFFKHLGARVDKYNCHHNNENVTLEGYEFGYNYPSFTIKKEIWEKGKGLIAQSYFKNITHIYGLSNGNGAK